MRALRPDVAQKQISSRIILGGRGGWVEEMAWLFIPRHTESAFAAVFVVRAAAAEFLSVGAGLNLFAAQKVVLRGPLIKRRASPRAPLSLSLWQHDLSPAHALRSSPLF